MPRRLPRLPVRRAMPRGTPTRRYSLSPVGHMGTTVRFDPRSVGVRRCLTRRPWRPANRACPLGLCAMHKTAADIIVHSRAFGPAGDAARRPYRVGAVHPRQDTLTPRSARPAPCRRGQALPDPPARYGRKPTPSPVAAVPCRSSPGRRRQGCTRAISAAGGAVHRAPGWTAQHRWTIRSSPDERAIPPSRGLLSDPLARGAGNQRLEQQAPCHQNQRRPG